MSSQELTLKNYLKQLKDNVRAIQDNFAEMLRTKSEYPGYEVQVRAAEIVRAYQALIQLVSEIRNFYIINDFILINQAIDQKSNPAPIINIDKSLVKLRDEIAIFLYELEIL
ncbi:Mediator of RNA polymerase II transcription subunit 22, partial [Fragariocoptes setiger]